MPTEAQLSEALVNADKAGDAKSARALATALAKVRKPPDKDALDASLSTDIERGALEGLKRTGVGDVVRDVIPGKSERYEPQTAAGRAAETVMSVGGDLFTPVGGEIKLAAKAPGWFKALSTIFQTGAKSAGFAGGESAAGQFADTGKVDLAKVGEAAKVGGEVGAGARAVTGAMALPRAIAKNAQESRDPAYTENVVNRLKEVGIPLRPAQEAGTAHAQALEDFFTKLGGRGKQDPIVKEQQAAVNRLVNREMGITDNAGNPLQSGNQRKVVSRKKELGEELGGIYERGSVPPGQIVGITALEPMNAPPQLMQQFRDAFSHGLTGKRYQVLRSELREQADRAFNTPDGPRWYWQARNALDNAFHPGNAEDATNLRRARYQYSNVKNVLELEKAGGIVDNNYDLAKLGEVSKRPGWHEQTPEQRPVYVYYGEAAKDAGLHPMRSGEVPKAGKGEDVGLYHHGALRAAASTLGLPAAGVLAGSLIGHPVLGLGAGVALKPAVRNLWYGGNVPPWLTEAGRRANVVVPSQFTESGNENQPP